MASATGRACAALRRRKIIVMRLPCSIAPLITFDRKRLNVAGGGSSRFWGSVR